MPDSISQVFIRTITTIFTPLHPIFFGSFDLTGNEFSKADWDTYSVELDALLKGGKEKIEKCISRL